jgi:hypothetical protein
MTAPVLSGPATATWGGYTLPVDISHVMDAISRKDYISILESPELFWLAFCSVYKTDVLQDVKISITEKSSVTNRIKRTIEEFRVYCLKGYKEHRNISLSVVKRTSDIFIRERQTLIDLTDWLSDSCPKIFGSWFLRCILPFLEDLCKLIGAELTRSTGSQMVESDRTISAYECLILEIKWAVSDHFVYPIAPIKIAQRQEDSQEAYALYQSQTLCDLKFVAADGEVCVHSLPMLLHGGEFIKATLTAPMREGAAKRIEFAEFTTDVLKGYIDFVYLGEEAFKPETFFASGRNVFELLRFAHMYGILPLIDVCTNLISLVAKPEDAGHLRELAAHYGNAHLVRLCDYLSPGASMMAFPKV